MRKPTITDIICKILSSSGKSQELTLSEIVDKLKNQGIDETPEKIRRIISRSKKIVRWSFMKPAKYFLNPFPPRNCAVKHGICR